MNCDGNENNGKGDAPHVFTVICFQLEDTIQMSLQIITDYKGTSCHEMSRCFSEKFCQVNVSSSILFRHN